MLSVLERSPDAPVDLREKSLYLAARILEMTGVVPHPGGYRAAQATLDSGAALRRFERIIAAQGRRQMPPAALYRCTIAASTDGRLREIDCWQIARVAKRAGAPANASAGVRMFKSVGEIVMRGEPLFEIHAESDSQLQSAKAYAESLEDIFHFGF